MKYFIPILLLMSSCKLFEPSEWHSQKRINKVEHYHPHLLAQYCAKEFPIKKDSLPGTPIVKSSSKTNPGAIVPVDCDSLMRARQKDAEKQLNSDSIGAEKAHQRPGENQGVFWIQCPPSTDKTDTIFYPVYITETNTAELDTEKRLHIKTKEDRDKKAGTVKTLTWLSVILGGLLVAGIVVVILLWKFKLKNVIS